MSDKRPNVKAAEIEDVEDVVIWAVDHDASVFGFWNEQWRWNRKVDTRMIDLETRQSDVETRAARSAGVMATVGAILGALVAAGLSALLGA